VIPYLDKPEMDALLTAPDRQTAQGRRDHALLLFSLITPEHAPMKPRSYKSASWIWRVAP